MSKVKTCCCGCSFRTGSLILLWLTLVASSMFILRDVRMLLDVYLHGVSYHYERDTFGRYRSLYNFFIAIIGLVVSVLGVHGIHNNKPRYLNGIYYYFCYGMIYSGVMILVLGSYSSFLYKFFFQETAHSMPPKYFILYVLASMFTMALCSYFISVLKSCRDSMRTRNKDNGFAGIPDPVPVGYHNDA